MNYATLYALCFALGFMIFATVGRFVPNLINATNSDDQMFYGVIVMGWLIGIGFVTKLVLSKKKTITAQDSQEAEENKWENYDYTKRL